MKKTAVLLVLIIAMVLGLTQAGFAGWGACKMGDPPPQLTADKLQNQAALLGLTDEQSKRILTIRQDHFNNTRDLSARLQKAMFEIRQMSWDKKSDPGKLNEKINEVNRLRGELYKQSQKCFEQVNSVLTEEQRTKYAQQRPGHRGKGFGAWGGM
ncbi:MAG: Spy/CpxP family protein refolding chaperone [Bacillota bacterium]